MDNKLNNCSKTEVLVVDDKPDNIRLLRGMLMERGYAVRAAPSGVLALQAAEAIAPDIVLMDINMPGMNGYETCIEMKQREALCKIPVIFVSALGEVPDKVRAFESGGIDYVIKPIEIDEIDARIKTHVGLQRLQQKLEDRNNDLCELEEVRDKLIHMIAHDLRNPLAVVMGGLGYLSICSGIEFDKVSCEILKSAETQAGLINRMLDDMLDVSLLEASEMPLRSSEADIEMILNAACANVVTEGKELKIEKMLGDRRTMNCDRDLVRRVVTNLLGNAAKSTPSGGMIQIVAKALPAATRFEVRDMGRGIPEEFHEKIFEKFGRVNGFQPAGVSSTGLGLSFCRLAVEAHGGEIGVESKVGDGSTFWFTLPEPDGDSVEDLPLLS